METTLHTNVPVIPVKHQERVPAQPVHTAPSYPLPKADSGTDISLKIKQAEARREQALQQAANTFAISDQRFTIYKDISGQFITRFTSLRDGRVTYIPEPDVLSWLNQTGKGATPTLSLEV